MLYVLALRNPKTWTCQILNSDIWCQLIAVNKKSDVCAVLKINSHKHVDPRLLLSMLKAVPAPHMIAVELKETRTYPLPSPRPLTDAGPCRNSNHNLNSTHIRFLLASFWDFFWVVSTASSPTLMPWTQLVLPLLEDTEWNPIFFKFPTTSHAFYHVHPSHNFSTEALRFFHSFIFHSRQDRDIYYNSPRIRPKFLSTTLFPNSFCMRPSAR